MAGEYSLRNIADRAAGFILSEYMVGDLCGIAVGLSAIPAFEKKVGGGKKMAVKSGI